MGRVWYCTREAVMDAFDVKESANRFAQVDAAIMGASDDVDAWLNRHKHGLAPTLATRYFDWPRRDGGGATRLWFDENELLEPTSIEAGGETLAVDTDVFLEPVNSGPPYTYAEINLTGSGSFTNSGTHQRAVEIAGTWGVADDSDAAGTLAAGVNASVTAWTVSDASLVGVGSVLRADDERVLVTGRSAVTTGQTLAGGMDAFNADRSLEVADGTALHEGEIVTVGTERMKIISITGNSATVERAVQGSVLAAHTIGDTVYALRSLRVQRGALGTTPASHSLGATLTTWHVPDLVYQLVKATAISTLEQEWSAYGQRVYSDEAERDSSGTDVISGRGLTDVRKQCARRYKRKFRKRAV